MIISHLLTNKNFSDTFVYGIWFTLAAVATFFLIKETQKEKVLGIIVSKRRHYSNSSNSTGQNFTYDFSYNDKIYKMPSNVGINLMTYNLNDEIYIYINNEKQTAMPKSSILFLLFIAISQIILSLYITFQ